MTVIGLVGEKGSGKGTFAQYLADEAPPSVRAARMRFSDLLRETLEAWSLPLTRHNLQELARVMDVTYGNGTLAHATQQRIAHLSADLVILDGVRWEADRVLIRSFPQSILVYLTASPRIRFERITGRHENIDDASASFAQFMAEEHAQAEQGIPAIGATADMRMVNEGSRDDLRTHTRAVLARALTRVASPT